MVDISSFPKFDGTGNYNIKNLIRDWKIRLDMCNTDSKTKLNAIKQCLVGQAWQTFATNHESLDTIDKLYDWLVANYCIHERPIYAMGRIIHMTQLPAENLDTFSNKLVTAWENALGHIFPINNKHAQIVLLGVLVKNIKPKLIKAIPNGFNPSIIAEFMAKMRIIEKELDEVSVTFHLPNEYLPGDNNKSFGVSHNSPRQPKMNRNNYYNNGNSHSRNRSRPYNHDNRGPIPYDSPQSKNYQHGRIPAPR
jgi:hypothetical protein